jgi:DNA-binding XRE family transcriptional regulator
MFIPDNLKITLAAARVNKGLSQSDVARILHVSNRTIVNWEKGQSSPNIHQADELCDLYERPRDSIKF